MLLHEQQQHSPPQTIRKSSTKTNHWFFVVNIYNKSFRIFFSCIESDFSPYSFATLWIFLIYKCVNSVDVYAVWYVRDKGRDPAPTSIEIY